MQGMVARNRGPRDYARIALGLIRLLNGVAALFAPSLLMRRLGVDARAQAATAYGMRMFGIRTILIGADLLLDRPEARREALRVAPIIHASDVLSAVTAPACAVTCPGGAPSWRR